jgi:hypothetical protein
MKGAVLGLSWEILARLRWLFILSLVYYVLAVAIVALVPESRRSVQLGSFLASPLLLLAFGIANSASYTDGIEMRTTRCGFTRRLFTLPASSFTLASVPFVLGTALLGLLWVFVALGLLRPCDGSIPLIVPALAAMTSMGWIQAFTWMPFPLPWLRAVVGALGCYALLLLPFVFADAPRWHNTIAMDQVGILLVCYIGAVIGVHLARHGALAGEQVQFDRREVSETPESLVPFSSPLRGQLWLEWRHFGWMSIIQVFLLVLFGIPLVHMLHFALSKEYVLTVIGPMAEGMGAAWMAASALLILPVAFSFVGGNYSTRHATPGRYGMAGIFATRAISNVEIIKAKLIITAIFAVVLWGQMVGLTLLWASITGHFGDMMERLGDMTGFPGHRPLVLLVGFLLCCVANWLWVVGNFWVGLTGRVWVSAVVLSAMPLLLLAVGLIVRGWQPSWYLWLVGGVTVGLLGKAISVVYACCKLLVQNCVKPSTLLLLLVGWGVLTTTLASVAMSLFVGGWLLFAGIVLVTPLATTLLAPFALAWDRHR